MENNETKKKTTKNEPVLNRSGRPRQDNELRNKMGNDMHRAGR